MLVLGEFDKLCEVFVNGFQTFSHFFGGGDRVLGEFAEIYGKLWIITVVSIKRGTTNACMLGIVVREFGEG